ncbi:MAG: iron-containing alcohol dehydrogenase [Verrucomicrobia bacterium]|nr:iron-containing alcohol dehydrogenase [Verrucomicrobiota bacterium]
MIKPFEFATAARIVFGNGAFQHVGEHARALGRRALVITGRDAGRAKPLQGLLAAEEIEAGVFSIAGEPSVDQVVRALEQVRQTERDLIIGFGGGSAVDAAKAVAALATNPGEPLDYLEVVGRGKPLTRPSLPCIAIPTTAGTGAEVTRNAVLSSPEHRVKVSLRSPFLLPKLAVVDPALTIDLPPEVTAWTGLDALTQLIEPYVSARANPLTDALCLQGIERVARSLRPAFHDGTNPQAREDMALASLLGGLALANAGLGAVHGFAAPIGGMYPAPHGAICAGLLPVVMEINARALRERQPDAEALHRFRAVAQVLTGRPDAAISDGIEWVAALCRELRIPGLGSYGIRAEDFGPIAEKAQKASSMKANPLTLNRQELEECLSRAL